MYNIIGNDRKQYDSISEGMMRQWIAEGRLNAQSLVQVMGETEWKPLSDFPEFANELAAKPPAVFDQGSMDAGGGREAALEKVKVPAIFLIVIAGLGIVYYLFNGIITLFLGHTIFSREMPPDIPPHLRAFFEGMQGPLSGLISLVIVAVNGFVLYGAIGLLRLRNRGVAIAASIITMAPCQCCCILGLPFGIWALTVLNKPEVKSHFS
jgi:hypothetical protein